MQPRRYSARRFDADVQSSQPYFEWEGKHVMPQGEDAVRLLTMVREIQGF